VVEVAADVAVLVVEVEEMWTHLHLFAADTLEVECLVLALGYCETVEAICFEREPRLAQDNIVHYMRKYMLVA